MPETAPTSLGKGSHPQGALEVAKGGKTEPRSTTYQWPNPSFFYDIILKVTNSTISISEKQANTISKCRWYKVLEWDNGRTTSFPLGSPMLTYLYKPH